MEARRIRLQGERGISRKTIAQGMPECSGCTCMLVCAFTPSLAHETAGAASTRHSLLPLSLGGKEFQQTSGAARRENAGLCRKCLHVIASEAKQSILSLCRNVDCFASLAMTWIGRSVLDTPHAEEMTVCGCYRTRSLPLRRHRNPGTVAAAHQHAVLGLAQ